jgi:predicted nucleotidyltransferase
MEDNKINTSVSNELELWRWNMLITRENLAAKREAILEIARRHGAHDVRIFGSVARGDNTEDSDLDLIVRFDPGRTLFDHGGLLMDLREFLGMKVDVISEGALSGRFGQIAKKEAVPL